MPDKKYTKVEEEIIQILDRMGDDPEPPAKPNLRLVHSERPKQRRIPTLPRLTRVSPGIILGGVFLFAFIALMTSGVVQLVAAALAIICFVAMLLGRGKTPRGAAPNFGPQTWRGRDITLSSDPSTPIAERISGWLRRMRR